MPSLVELMSIVARGYAWARKRAQENSLTLRATGLKMPTSVLADFLGLQDLVAACRVGNGVPGNCRGMC